MNTAVRTRLVLVAIGLLLTGQRSEAQTRTTAAVDATVGGGFGNGGEFFDRDLHGARIAASVRRSSSARIGLFGEVAMDWLAISSGHSAVGIPSSRGGFEDSYPELSGPTATIGIVAGPTDRVEMRVGVGGGAYGADGTRVGAVVSQSDVTFFPVAHVGIILGARWIVVPRFRGDRLSVLPWAVGLRVR